MFSKPVSKAVTLFSNIGVGEALLDGFRVEVACDIDRRRCEVYRRIYPDTSVVEGDICDPKTQAEYCEKAKGARLLIATPPCQGFSQLNRVTENDPRNNLVFPLIDVLKRVRPAYVLIENVPGMLKSKIDGTAVLKTIYSQLSELYPWNDERVVDAAHYGTPQHRNRAIVLLTRKGEPEWHFPRPTTPNHMTLREAIGDLPPIEPHQKERVYSSFHPLHYSRPMSRRITECLRLVREGWSATEFNGSYAALLYMDDGNGGGRRVEGFNTIYRRQLWNRPAYTLTAACHNPGASNTIHPRDPRTFTILEAMRIMGLPDDWPMPRDLSYRKAMEYLGEGVPPTLIRALTDVIANP